MAVTDTQRAPYTHVHRYFLFRRCYIAVAVALAGDGVITIINRLVITGITSMVSSRVTHLFHHCFT